MSPSRSTASALIIIAAFVSEARGESGHWNYANEAEWPGACQTGASQSPIDLSNEIAVDMIYRAFEFQNYDRPYSARVKNNGHSVAITLNDTDAKPTVSGGGLNGQYLLDHFHFHWQSEHTIQTGRFPLEMHLVHYSDKYVNLSTASNFAGGVAVLGVLFEFSIDDDQDFVPLIEVMNKVETFPEVEVALERQITARSFLPRNTGEYYRYQGSLTTPDCNEGVTWTVFTRTLPLSADQIRHFESVWSSEGLLALNYRQVQPINGRPIYLRRSPPPRVSSDDSSASVADRFCLVTIILAATATHLF